MALFNFVFLFLVIVCVLCNIVECIEKENDKQILSDVKEDREVSQDKNETGVFTECLECSDQGEDPFPISLLSRVKRSKGSKMRKKKKKKNNQKAEKSNNSKSFLNYFSSIWKKKEAKAKIKTSLPKEGSNDSSKNSHRSNKKVKKASKRGSKKEKKKRKKSRKRQLSGSKKRDETKTMKNRPSNAKRNGTDNPTFEDQPANDQSQSGSSLLNQFSSFWSKDRQNTDKKTHSTSDRKKGSKQLSISQRNSETKIFKNRHLSKKRNRPEKPISKEQPAKDQSQSGNSLLNQFSSFWSTGNTRQNADKKNNSTSNEKINPSSKQNNIQSVSSEKESKRKSSHKGKSLLNHFSNFWDKDKSKSDKKTSTSSSNEHVEIKQAVKNEDRNIAGENSAKKSKEKSLLQQFTNFWKDDRTEKENRKDVSKNSLDKKRLSKKEKNAKKQKSTKKNEKNALLSGEHDDGKQLKKKKLKRLNPETKQTLEVDENQGKKDAEKRSRKPKSETHSNEDHSNKKRMTKKTKLRDKRKRKKENKKKKRLKKQKHTLNESIPHRSLISQVQNVTNTPSTSTKKIVLTEASTFAGDIIRSENKKIKNKKEMIETELGNSKSDQKTLKENSNFESKEKKRKNKTRFSEKRKEKRKKKNKHKDIKSDDEIGKQYNNQKEAKKGMTKTKLGKESRAENDVNEELRNENHRDKDFNDQRIRKTHTINNKKDQVQQGTLKKNSNATFIHFQGLKSGTDTDIEERVKAKNKNSTYEPNVKLLETNEGLPMKNVVTTKHVSNLNETDNSNSGEKNEATSEKYENKLEVSIINQTAKAIAFEIELDERIKKGKKLRESLSDEEYYKLLENAEIKFNKKDRRVMRKLSVLNQTTKKRIDRFSFRKMKHLNDASHIALNVSNSKVQSDVPIVDINDLKIMIVNLNASTFMDDTGSILMLNEGENFPLQQKQITIYDMPQHDDPRRHRRVRNNSKSRKNRKGKFFIKKRKYNKTSRRRKKGKSFLKMMNKIRNDKYSKRQKQKQKYNGKDMMHKKEEEAIEKEQEKRRVTDKMMNDSSKISKVEPKRREKKKRKKNMKKSKKNKRKRIKQKLSTKIQNSKSNSYRTYASSRSHRKNHRLNKSSRRLRPYSMRHSINPRMRSYTRHYQEAKLDDVMKSKSKSNERKKKLIQKQSKAPISPRLKSRRHQYAMSYPRQNIRRQFLRKRFYQSMNSRSRFDNRRLAKRKDKNLSIQVQDNHRESPKHNVYQRRKGLRLKKKKQGIKQGMNFKNDSKTTGYFVDNSERKGESSNRTRNRVYKDDPDSSYFGDNRNQKGKKLRHQKKTRQLKKKKGSYRDGNNLNEESYADDEMLSKDFKSDRIEDDYPDQYDDADYHDDYNIRDEYSRDERFSKGYPRDVEDEAYPNPEDRRYDRYGYEREGRYPSRVSSYYDDADYYYGYQRLRNDRNPRRYLRQPSRFNPRSRSNRRYRPYPYDRQVGIGSGSARAAYRRQPWVRGDFDHRNPHRIRNQEEENWFGHESDHRRRQNSRIDNRHNEMYDNEDENVGQRGRQRSGQREYSAHNKQDPELDGQEGIPNQRKYLGARNEKNSDFGYRNEQYERQNRFEMTQYNQRRLENQRRLQKQRELDEKRRQEYQRRRQLQKVEAVVSEKYERIKHELKGVLRYYTDALEKSESIYGDIFNGTRYDIMNGLRDVYEGLHGSNDDIYDAVTCSSKTARSIFLKARKQREAQIKGITADEPVLDIEKSQSMVKPRNFRTILHKAKMETRTLEKDSRHLKMLEMKHLQMQARLQQVKEHMRDRYDHETVLNLFNNMRSSIDYVNEGMAHFRGLRPHHIDRNYMMYLKEEIDLAEGVMKNSKVAVRKGMRKLIENNGLFKRYQRERFRRHNPRRQRDGTGSQIQPNQYNHLKQMISKGKRHSLVMNRTAIQIGRTMQRPIQIAKIAMKQKGKNSGLLVLNVVIRQLGKNLESMIMNLDKLRMAIEKEDIQLPYCDDFIEGSGQGGDVGDDEDDHNPRCIKKEGKGNSHGELYEERDEDFTFEENDSSPPKQNTIGNALKGFGINLNGYTYKMLKISEYLDESAQRLGTKSRDLKHQHRFSSGSGSQTERHSYISRDVLSNLMILRRDTGEIKSSLARIFQKLEDIKDFKFDELKAKAAAVISAHKANGNNSIVPVNKEDEKEEEEEKEKEKNISERKEVTDNGVGYSELFKKEREIRSDQDDLKKLESLALNTYSKSCTKMNKIHSNISTLMQKIEKAKTMLSSFQLSVSKTDDSPIPVSIPDVHTVDSSGSLVTAMTICIKPKTLDGTVLYVQGNQSASYSLTLDGGQLTATVYNAEKDDLESVSSENYLQENKWYTIRISRAGKTMNMTVKGQDEEMTQSSVQVDEMPMLQPRLINSYIGGLPPNAEISGSPWLGCVGEFTVDDQLLSVFQPALSGNQPSLCSDHCLSDGKKLSWSFEGDGFVQYDWPTQSDVEVISFNFKTNQPTASILSALKRRMRFHVVATLVEGSMRIEYSNQVWLSTNDTLNDGRIHTLNIQFSSRNLVLELDGDNSAFLQLQERPIVYQSIKEGILLGSVISESKEYLHKRPLIGCVGNLKINDIPTIHTDAVDVYRAQFGQCTMKTVWQSCIHFSSTSVPISFGSLENSNKISLLVNKNATGPLLLYAKSDKYEIKVKMMNDGIYILHKDTETETVLVKKEEASDDEFFTLLSVRDEGKDVYFTAYGQTTSINYIGFWGLSDTSSPHLITVGEPSADKEEPFEGSISQLMIGQRLYDLPSYHFSNKLDSCSQQLKPISQNVIEEESQYCS